MAIACALVAALLVLSAHAQVAPSRDEAAAYTGLFAAAARGDAKQVTALIAAGARPDVRDAHGRTPLHVATYGRHTDAMRALVAAGADPNAVENDRYDIVTIAAVADDPATLRVALALGGSARNVTSPNTLISVPSASEGASKPAKASITPAPSPLIHAIGLRRDASASAAANARRRSDGR